jgi:hypothetical protein
MHSSGCEDAPAMRSLTIHATLLRCRVQLNTRSSIGDPVWASKPNDKPDHEPGVIEWDGMLLDDWQPAKALNRRGRSPSAKRSPR